MFVCDRACGPSDNGCAHETCGLPESVLVKKDVCCDVMEVLSCDVNKATRAFDMFGTRAV